MTINRVENPGAVFAAYLCHDCDASKVEPLRPSDPKYNPYDVLDHVETGIGKGEQAVSEHDRLHPNHSILIWHFDKDHPLSQLQVMSLKSAGVKHASSYGSRRSKYK